MTQFRHPTEFRLRKEALQKIALLGNPNSGKTSLFNLLTGLNQRVGNFPGVTVDRKASTVKLSSGKLIELIDLPGAYSLSPRSTDEKVVRDVLLNEADPDAPQAILIVIDSSSLRRGLFLATQVIDLQIPTVLALNMGDVAKKRGRRIDVEQLNTELGVPVVEINARTRSGIDELKAQLESQIPFPKKQFFNPEDFLVVLGAYDHSRSAYARFHEAINPVLEADEGTESHSHRVGSSANLSAETQLREISARYQKINAIADKVIIETQIIATQDLSTKADKWLTHPVVGTLVFLGVFFLLFQAVFSLASYPMDWIDHGMGMLISWTKSVLPDHFLSNLLTEGLLAGLNGVIVFIPQIMILFGLITLLEDSGYMSRVSFLNDKVLSLVGMNGKSIVPLVGGFACAVPAIMSARNIENAKVRLITMLVTPLMSCSARLPVYIFLIAFIVPDDHLWGFLSLQGLFMLGLYLLGIIFSGIVAWFLTLVIKGSKSNSFVLELPSYKAPALRNVLSSMINKGKTFVWEAGKIIVIVSIALWFLASFGPGDAFEKIEEKYQGEAFTDLYTEDEITFLESGERLRCSYAGTIGRWLEPAIRPLGFDWKIGIALTTSFAAREVFVGTMATIYSLEGDTDNIAQLRDKLMSQKDPITGEPVMNLPRALSLIMFYVFAMQCMSTVAIMRKETGGWKWPIIQFIFLTALAYLSSLAVYQALT